MVMDSRRLGMTITEHKNTKCNLWKTGTVAPELPLFTYGWKPKPRSSKIAYPNSFYKVYIPCDQYIPAEKGTVTCVEKFIR